MLTVLNVLSAILLDRLAVDAELARDLEALGYRVREGRAIGMLSILRGNRLRSGETF